MILMEEYACVRCMEHKRMCERVSDRVKSVKLEIEGVMMNVVSGYAPYSHICCVM